MGCVSCTGKYNNSSFNLKTPFFKNHNELVSAK